MRSPAFLLAGLVLVVSGVAIMLSDIPGRYLLGGAAVVLGLTAKITGFLVGVDPEPERARRLSGRVVTTLDGRVVESPTPGLPPGRALLVRRGGDEPARARHRAAAPSPGERQAS